MRRAGKVTRRPVSRQPLALEQLAWRRDRLCPTAHPDQRDRQGHQAKSHKAQTESPGAKAQREAKAKAGEAKAKDDQAMRDAGLTLTTNPQTEQVTATDNSTGLDRESSTVCTTPKLANSHTRPRQRHSYQNS